MEALRILMGLRVQNTDGLVHGQNCKTEEDDELGRQWE